MKRYRRAHPDRNWARYLALLGMTPERYDAMLAAQGGRCAICGTEACSTGKRLSMDHDHRCCPGPKSCGECVRGLLCRTCNVGIGNLKDDPVIIAAALEYLRCPNTTAATTPRPAAPS